MYNTYEKPRAILVPRKDCNNIDILNDYIEDLAQKDDPILGQTVMHFIECTKESTVDDPTLIMRSIR